MAAPLPAQQSPSLGDAARQLRVAKASPAAPAVKPPQSGNEAMIAAGLNADAGSDEMAMDKYQAAIGELLRSGQIDRLEEIARAARSGKTRFAGGVWKLHIFYEGLQYPAAGRRASEQDWITLLNALEQWKSQKPESITPRVALAGAYERYGSVARGSGYADTVGEDGWKRFGERVQKSEQILKEAATLKEKCPEWYYGMMVVALDAGWERQSSLDLFEQAIKFEPTYYYYYRQRAISLLPRWNGKPGEMEQFAEKYSSRLGTSEDDIIYYEIFAEMGHQCNCGEQLQHLSWTRAKKGYAAMEMRYQVSVYKLKQFAQMAMIVGDADAAEKAGARLMQP